VPLEHGHLAVMPAVDGELGYAGLKAYAVAGGRSAFVVVPSRPRARVSPR
jgi:hypothetical protein